MKLQGYKYEIIKQEKIFTWIKWVLDIENFKRIWHNAKYQSKI